MFLWALRAPNSRAVPGSPHSSYATDSGTRGTVVFFYLFKKLKTLNFKVSMLIKSHSSRSTTVNFSLIGRRCYE